MGDASGERVVFQGDSAIATLPEGTERKMKVVDLIAHLAPSVPDTCGVILPDGVKNALPVKGGVILVHQTPPQVWGFRWIANDSETEFGPGTKYRTVRLGLPYVIVLAMFGTAKRGEVALSHSNECYFSNSPIEAERLDTSLCYPALLNCSKVSLEEGGGLPLSWICTQHMPKKDLRGHKTMDAAFQCGLGALLRHLFESGFNRSSEHHEGASGFSASVDAKIDPRVASVEAWEKATSEDPLFALEVPWLPVGHTLREIMARTGGVGRGFETTADLARLIFNPPKSAAKLWGSQP